MSIKGKVVPPNFTDAIVENGRATQDFYGTMVNITNTAPLRGSGSPESVVDARIMTQYMDIDAVDTPGTYLYMKTTETGKTGWKLV